MNISFSISPAPTVINNIAVVVYKDSAPSVPVASQEFTPPHTSPRNITFTGLDPVPFIVNTYETPGLPVIGTLRHSFIYNPEYSDVDIKVQYINMPLDSTSYDVPADPTPEEDWDGYRVLYIDRRGYGAQRLGVEMEVRDEPDDDPKGFDLLDLNTPFGDDELVIVTLISRIVRVTPIMNIAKVIYDEIILTNDTTVNADDKNKTFLLQGAFGVQAFTVNLPTLGTFDNFSNFHFNSIGGNHVNVTINAGTDKILFYSANGTPTEQWVNKLHLGQCEQLLILNTATEWRVVFISDGILNVGKEFEADSKVFCNCRFLDGSILQRNVYRRLWEYIDTLSGAVTSDGNWMSTSFNYKAFFSIGDGSTTFRLKRLYSAGFARPVDGTTRLPGTWIDSMVMNHGHEETIGELPTTLFGKTADTATVGQYNTTATHHKDLTSRDIWVLKNGILQKQAASEENLPPSYGIYKLIHT